jgi:hypothetical protein
MRQWLIFALLMPPVATVLMMVLLRPSLKRFQRTVPLIRTPVDLSSLKKLVTVQMYAALIALALMAVPTLVWIYGHFVEGHLGWPDLLLFVFVPIVIWQVVAGKLSGPAKEVRAISAVPELQAERDHVVDVWLNRVFPDW